MDFEIRMTCVGILVLLLTIYNSEPQFQFSSVPQLCPTLCDPMNRSMPGLPVHHQLLEFTQTHVHRVSDAIQPSHPHPLSSPSPPAPNPSQHQGLFQWVNSSHEVAKVLDFQPQHQSFQLTPRFPLGLVGSPCSPRDSQESSITSHIHNWVLCLLWLHPFILSGVISPLISCSILGTYWSGKFLFQYPIILPFHTVHEPQFT